MRERNKRDWLISGVVHASVIQLARCCLAPAARSCSRADAVINQSPWRNVQALG